MKSGDAPAPKSPTDFCKVTGRQLAENPNWKELEKSFRSVYLEQTDLADLAPPIAVTDTGRLEAFNLSGAFEGIIIDEIYVKVLYRITRALLSGGGTRDIGLQMVEIISREFDEAEHSTEALILRHERYSRLFEISSLASELSQLIELDELMARMERLGERSEANHISQVFSFLALHETGHWFTRVNSDDSRISKALQENRSYIDSIAESPIMAVINRAASNESSSKASSPLNLEIRSLRENLPVETFCDRFVLGSMVLRETIKEGEWADAFVLFRVIQEANRILLRSKWIGRDFLTHQQFLEQKPHPSRSLAERASDVYYMRAWIASWGIGNLVHDAYEMAEKANPPAVETVEDEASQLGRQIIAAFSVLSGARVDQDLFILLRIVKAKMADEEVSRFYGRLAEQFSVIDEDSMKEAIDSIIRGVGDELFE